MAEPKSTPPGAAAAHGQGAAPPAKPAKPTMSKMEAVKRALATLGKDAKPLDIQAHIKTKYGIVMSNDHISTYKGEIARKEAKAAAARAQAAPARPAAAGTQAAAGKGPGSILLEDVLTAKALLDRIGAERLRILIDGLAK